MFTTLFLDLNSYFASCEQQLRPEMRDVPLAVAPMMVPTTCIIAASYSAKAFGVKTGVLVGDAMKMCPGLQIVPARPEKYVEFHHKILAAIDNCIPVAAVHSIDEVSCALLGRERDPAYALDLAARLKKSILSNVGVCLKCSIGLATNTVLAKVATDMQKPDGLVCIRKEELPECLFKLKLSDLPGIGPRMERRLFMQGIESIQALCSLSQQQLRNAWGSVWGARWWYLLRGEEIPIEVSRTKSLGHQHVLPPQFRNEPGARAVIVRLIDKAASRLRHEGLSAAEILFWVKCRNGDWTRKFGLLDGRDTLEMTRIFGKAWSEQPAQSPLIVGVTLLGLLPFVGLTGSLFIEDRRREALNGALDRVNRKFGAGTIHPGSMIGAADTAPMRIAFKTIPDLDLL